MAALPTNIRPLMPGARYSEPRQGCLSRAQVLSDVTTADGLISLLSLAVDEELFEAGQGLKIVANYAVGYDNIDVALATKRGVVVSNTPDVLTDATADFAFTLLLACARRLGESETLLRSGQWLGWAPNLLLGRELRGARLGVIGAGRIGVAMLRRAQGFGMELFYSSPQESVPANALGAQRMDRQALLRGSDVVSLHCPLNPETTHLINAIALEDMKSDAILINTARGGCIDQKALVDALQNGAIGGAGLDVFAEEPHVPESLLRCPNVVLAPHIASATTHARSQMAEICARTINAVLSGRCPSNVVNPDVMA